MLKGLEDLHIWILWNFMGEFMDGALWVAEGVSFQKLMFVCEDVWFDERRDLASGW